MFYVLFPLFNFFSHFLFSLIFRPLLPSALLSAWLLVTHFPLLSTSSLLFSLRSRLLFSLGWREEMIFFCALSLVIFFTGSFSHRPYYLDSPSPSFSRITDAAGDGYRCKCNLCILCYMKNQKAMV